MNIPQNNNPRNTPQNLPMNTPQNNDSMNTPQNILPMHILKMSRCPTYHIKGRAQTILYSPNTNYSRRVNYTNYPDNLQSQLYKTRAHAIKKVSCVNVTGTRTIVMFCEYEIVGME